MNTERKYEKVAEKVIDLFADHRLGMHEVQFVAFYTAYLSGSTDILDKLQEFGKQLDKHRERKEEDDRYTQDTLF